MKLTDFQKKLVDDIRDGNVTDLKSFNERHIEFEKANYKGVGERGMSLRRRDQTRGSFVVRSSTEVKIFKNENETFKKYLEFIALWDYLEANRIIVRVMKARSGEINEYFFYFFKNDGQTPNQDFHSIIWDYLDYDIAPLPTISDYIARGYLTAEEYNLEQEKRDRRTAQQVTIGIAIFTVVASSLFNYFTYTKDRYVYIKNEDAFKDTIKVIIIDNKTKNQTKEGVTKSPNF
jgi:hypothetical protein